MGPTNGVVTKAIDAVCAGDHLTADHAAAVLAEIMEGRANPAGASRQLLGISDRHYQETIAEALVGAPPGL